MRTLAHVSLSLALLFACDSSSDATPGKAATPSTKAEAPSVHAPADAKPGSYQDWCDEHGVPESQCTRCDASLVPAFKATGDWCEEHGLPESQCTKCKPDLKIVRPPRT